ncbi:putative RNA-directed DNA polymerase from transposon X-element [Trichonephila clavipes]|nr:putative RNA-directed DNA polymerase from transposon X-element [Trichonephila clavipes]
MRSGDLFIEVNSSKQALALASLKQLAHFDIQVKQHATLNYSRGVISAADLYNVTEEEILENMAEQNVSQVRRITIRRDGQVLKTKHLILTFATPDLPQSVKVAYLHCPVRPYIPNPLRCFQCQRFGHSKTTCRGQPTCARCAEILPNVVHRKGNYCLKNKNKISYPEARRIVSSRTPVSGISYAAITKKSTKTIAIQTDEPTTTTPNSPTHGKITAKPNFITVDTSKPVSTPPNVKKTRKTRIKESGVLANKKKRSNLSKKPHDMGEDVMEIHASQSDESLLDDLSPKPSSSGSLRGASAKS